MCVCALSVEAPVSKSHLISQAPRGAQLVFIKCRYFACAENERYRVARTLAKPLARFPLLLFFYGDGTEMASRESCLRLVLCFRI